MSNFFFDKYKKPVQQIGLSEWHNKQQELHQSAQNKKCESFDLRYNSKSLMSETSIETKWNYQMSNYKLFDRISEISHWERIFQSLLEYLKNEIQLLTDEKVDTEKELELLDNPLQIASTCVEKRNNRTLSEITYDDGDVELKREIDLIGEVRKLFINHIKIAWDKLNRLEEIKSKITNEIQDKFEAIKIDSENIELDRMFPNSTHKPHALNIPEQSVSYENWLEHTQHLKQQAENELSDTYSLREIMRASKDKSKLDIETQQDATNYALRKRSFTSQKASNELEWQKLKVEKEIDSLNKEINELQKTLRAKSDDMKCVETRLENRTYRPHYELCQDEVEFGLKYELEKLQSTKGRLESNINYAKSTNKDLNKVLDGINVDLENKKHSLTTDVMCLDMRSILVVRDGSQVQNETDRNIILTDLSKELSLETIKAFTK